MSRGLQSAPTSSRPAWRLALIPPASLPARCLADLGPIPAGPLRSISRPSVVVLLDFPEMANGTTTQCVPHGSLDRRAACPAGFEPRTIFGRLSHEAGG